MTGYHNDDNDVCVISVFYKWETGTQERYLPSITSVKLDPPNWVMSHEKMTVCLRRRVEWEALTCSAWYITSPS